MIIRVFGTLWILYFYSRSSVYLSPTCSFSAHLPKFNRAMPKLQDICGSYGCGCLNWLHYDFWRSEMVATAKKWYSFHSTTVNLYNPSTNLTLILLKVSLTWTLNQVCYLYKPTQNSKCRTGMYILLYIYGGTLSLLIFFFKKYFCWGILCSLRITMQRKITCSWNGFPYIRAPHRNVFW